MLTKKETLTVREAAEKLGLSVQLVRLRCAEGKCPAEYHEFPGTGRGFYLIGKRGMAWLEKHATPRPRESTEDE